MFDSLRICQFRGLTEFELPHLGRVNLLVGTNNSGKSSILEAVQLLASIGDPSVLWQMAARRGERLYDTGRSRPPYSPEVDVAHFFFGHEAKPGCEFSVNANAANGANSLVISVIEMDRQLKLFEDDVGTVGGDEGVDLTGNNLAMQFSWPNSGVEPLQLKLTSRGGLTTDSLRRYPRYRAEEVRPVRFISTAGLAVEDVVARFEEVVLTREEESVIDALRMIEPSVDRLATVGVDRPRPALGERGGILVKCRDTAQRVPIGSMGDGLWRMLGLALAIATAEGGVLLVDEIDTGLHVTVMDRMWRLINEASRRLSVQVFATTHSRDCYESLAAIARDNVSEGSEVTIQRISREQKRSVAYTEQEIVAAAERGTEVR